MAKIEFNGRIPYVSALKDKYEGNTINFYSREDQPIIYCHKNINILMYNIETGEINELLISKANKDNIIPKCKCQKFKFTKGEALINNQEDESEIVSSTLLSDDLSVWFKQMSFLDDYPDFIRANPCKWQFLFKDNIVETFVSRRCPEILEVSGKHYILVEDHQSCHDVYEFIE